MYPVLEQLSKEFQNLCFPNQDIFIEECWTLLKGSLVFHALCSTEKLHESSPGLSVVYTGQGIELTSNSATIMMNLAETHLRHDYVLEDSFVILQIF
jgi:hypothetical protein